MILLTLLHEWAGHHYLSKEKRADFEGGGLQ